MRRGGHPEEVEQDVLCVAEYMHGSSLAADTEQTAPRLGYRSLTVLAHSCCRAHVCAPALRVLTVLRALTGAGTFGIVRRAVWKEGDVPVAVKQLQLPAELRRAGGSSGVAAAHASSSSGDVLDVEDLLKEVAILRRLNNPHVLRLREYFLSDDTLQIVTDLLPGGPLLDALLAQSDGHGYTEAEAQAAFASLLRALHSLHKQNITHRDVKLENLLLADAKDLSTACLVDFGLAWTEFEAGGDGPRWMAGTAAYMAPEVAQRRVPYDSSADLWSAGVVLHLLLTGLTPFAAAVEQSAGDDADAAVLLGAEAVGWLPRFDGPEWADISPQAIDLCRQLLSLQPSERPAASRALMHDWFSQPSQHKPSRRKPLAGTLAQLRRYAKAVELPVVEFAQGAFLGTVGERSTSVFLIKSGTVEVLLEEPQPEEDSTQPRKTPCYRVIARHGEGELCGEVDLAPAAKMARTRSASSAKLSRSGSASSDDFVAITSAKRVASRWIGKRRRTSLRAATAVKAVVIGQQDFSWVLQHDPSIAAEVEKFVERKASEKLL